MPCVVPLQVKVGLHVAAPDRRPASSKGEADARSDDLYAILSEQLASGHVRTSAMGNAIAELGQMLLASGNSDDVSSTAILNLLERLTRIHAIEQAGLQRSVELLHHMLAPNPPTVQVSVTQVNVAKASVKLGGRRARR